MKLLSIRLDSHCCRAIAVVSVLCLLCSACTPAGESDAPAAEKTNVISLKEIHRPHTILTYSPDINSYPALAQRLAVETEELLEDKCSTDYAFERITEDDPEFDPASSNSYSICRLDYKITVQTPKVVAVLGDLYYYMDGAHGDHEYRTHVWLPHKQQWLTIPQLLNDPPGWIAVRDYVRDQIYNDPNALIESHYSFTRSAWTERTSEVKNFSLFQPLMNNHGQISELRLMFDVYGVGGTQIVDVFVPARVLYPHVSSEYRDLFVQP